MQNFRKKNGKGEDFEQILMRYSQAFACIGQSVLKISNPVHQDIIQYISCLKFNFKEVLKYTSPKCSQHVKASGDTQLIEQNTEEIEGK
jgi:hypothetical protein